MSLVNYQHLQSANLGCALPTMVAATVDCQSSVHTGAQTRALIDAFTPQQGWFMLRDRLVIDAISPPTDDFIEGEWCHGQNSLKVRQLYGDQFQLTRMTLSNKSTTEQAYNEQVVCLRNDLKQTVAIYRLWWILQQDPLMAGRWAPRAQQFMGFNFDDSGSKS
jgi:hypothetical protein